MRHYFWSKLNDGIKLTLTARHQFSIPSSYQITAFTPSTIDIDRSRSTTYHTRHQAQCIVIPHPRKMLALVVVFLLLPLHITSAPLRGHPPSNLFSNPNPPIAKANPTTESIRLDTHAIDVALAVNAAVETLNKERIESGFSKAYIVNILSAKKTMIHATTTQFTLKVQLRKAGGRLEFQQFVINKVTSFPVQRHPPQTVTSVSEAIVVPPSKPSLYTLVHHNVVRSPFSAPRHRASMVLVPAGKVVAATTLIKSMTQGDAAPIATPPV